MKKFVVLVILCALTPLTYPIIAFSDVTSLHSSLVSYARNHLVLTTGALLASLSMLHDTVRDTAYKCLISADDHTHELRWDWPTIDTTQVQFPSTFMFGSAVSEYQTSGACACPASNWAAWEQKTNLQPSGNACDSWQHYERDIECLKKLGVSAYRFSIDWSAIEPAADVIDESALAHYVDLCDALLTNGIKPVVTLHHFVHPQWFEELGGFEKAENIHYFVDFATLVFNRLKDKVALWATFNEPGIYVFQSYVRGCYPPGQSGIAGIKLASKVLKNMLDAHVTTYHTLKKLPGGDKAQIGIVHQYLTFERFHTAWSPFKAAVEHLVGSTITSFVRDTIINYFATGEYQFQVMGIVNEQDNSSIAQRIHSLDYIGLNYYSHVFLRVHHRLHDTVYPGFRPCDIQTSMPYAVYAEGLYRAIKHIAQLDLPIYITENGAPSADDTCKDIWIRRYLYAVNKAIQDGYDVRGYFYWSLLDNYEWDMGYTQQFGLYHVDFKTQERTLRPGAQWFVDVVKKHSN